MAAITILDTISANVATPSSGHTSVFVDDTGGTSTLKMKDSSGNVIVVGSGGGASFTGNLAGNVLYDSTNLRSILKPFPLSTVASTGGVVTIATQTPAYTSGVLNTQSQQTIGSSIQGNTVVATASGTNKQFTLASAYNQVYAVQNMNSQDRTRGIDGVVEIVTNGYDWGNDGTTSLGRATHIGVRGTVQTFGNGTVGHIVGMNAVTNQVGTGGASTINYMTGQQVSLQQAGTGTLNVGTARLVGGTLATISGATITNVVGLHIINSWVSGSGSVTNKYAILVDPTDSPIVSNSAIKTTNVLTVGSYASTALPSGTAGSLITISDNEDRPAYWNTFHSAWQYVFNNTNV